MTYRIGFSVRARMAARNRLPSFAQATPRIDHRDGVTADDEPNVGNGTFVFTGHQRGCARVHKKPGCDFADRQRSLRLLRDRWLCKHDACSKNN
jgi:hypothetical protein